MTVARAAFEIAAAHAEEANKGTSGTRERILAALGGLERCWIAYDSVKGCAGSRPAYIPQQDGCSLAIAGYEAGDPKTVSPKLSSSCVRK